MEVTVRHLGNVKFEVRTRRHRVICDQPLDNGGGDEGMSPPEFLLASLGTCAGFYAAQYLKTRALAAEGLEVTVTAEKALHPARLGSFRIEVTVPKLDAHHLAGVERAVNACLVHNTLTHSPVIEIVIHSAADLQLA